MPLREEYSEIEEEEEVLECFCSYLNSSIQAINSIKGSLYDILNISLQSSQKIIQFSFPSMKANCKRTLDDLKRISSILKGYSKSKHLQRQQEESRKSRRSKDSRVLSKQSKSQYSNYNRQLQYQKRIDSGYQKNNLRLNLENVTFDGLVEKIEEKSDQNPSKNQNKVKKMQSFDRFSHNFQCGDSEGNYRDNCKNKVTFISPQHSKSGLKNSFFQRQRSKTVENEVTFQKQKDNDQIISQTQKKFQQCLSNHEEGMSEIIRRNNECLSMLKQIQKNILLKKQRRNLA